MKKLYLITLVVVLSILLGSCKDWLDVKPRSEELEEETYQTEEGFKDVLTGIYIQLASDKLYGSDMTMVIPEVLAQLWVTDSRLAPGYEESHTRYLVQNFNYTDNAVKKRFETIWSKYYEAIININSILGHVDGAKGMLTGGNYELIKGEALGLRAFLHFELLRMFGPAPSEAKAAELTIPYVLEVTRDPSKLLSLSYEKVVQYIDEDLKNAEKLLENDPITLFSNEKLNNPKDDGLLNDEYHYYRNHRFNLYAVKATMARFYLWTNNKAEAEKFADQVIKATNPDGSNKFELAKGSDVDADDLTFKKEHIFALHNSNLNNITKGLFDYAAKELLTQEERWVKALYEMTASPDEIRNKGIRFWQTLGPNNIFCFKKYLESSHVPMIRLAEMYLIKMESTPSLDVTKEYLELFRISRNMSTKVVSNVKDPTSLRSRLTMEYRKEFFGEGQMFYYYKRNNTPKLAITNKVMTPEKYRIPKPEKQTVFE